MGKFPALTISLVLATLALAPVGNAGGADPAQVPQPDPWAPYRFLAGSWSGDIGGNLGTGVGEREYEFIVDDVYLRSRHSSHRPPQPESPEGDSHEEIGIFSFDRANRRVVYRQFVNEGFVNRYLCEPQAEGGGFVCTTEAVESGPGMRARWAVTPLDADAFEETFELAGAGRELSLLFENRWSRRGDEAAPAAGVVPTHEPDLEESLRAAELAFAASAGERDRERFSSFLDAEAIFVGSTVLRGKAAILEAWSAFFADDGPRLAWHPEIVEVQPSGAMGLTRGPYTLTHTRTDGAPVVESGSFSSIWRRQTDGSWKVVFDSGCPAG